MGFNSCLWKDKARFDLLLDVLQLQYNLEDLDLERSKFSKVQTEKLLRKVSESDILQNLTTLNLCESANFAYDKSIRLFALILAKANQIKQIDIRKQIGKIKIDVEIDE